MQPKTVIYPVENRFFKYYVLTLAVAISLMAAVSGCKKDDINTSPDVKLSFSTDSVNFDTVFATVGTATFFLKVYNTDDSYVNVSQIRLNNDPNNSYRINVDGLPGENFVDTEIGPNDSLYIFIEVTVTPDANILYPFVEGDISFTTNGNEQQVKLVAWGWDAIFYVPTVFPTSGLPDYTLIDNDNPEATVTWTAEKPIVVYGYLVVDSLQTLNIEPGTQVFFHQGAGLWVYRYGRINAIGSMESPIVFQGDRLEAFYEEQPGQWDRIWVNEGNEDQVFEHCVIKNNFIGIQAESDPFLDNNPPQISENKLVLKNVAIRNNSIAGLFTENFQVEGENVLLSSGGQYLLAGTGGGSYNFDHCTFGNNWNLSIRQTPAVFLTNFAQVDASTVVVGPILTSKFRNCIIHGNGFNELGFDLDTDQPIDLTFDYCLIRGEEEELAPYIKDYFGTAFIGNDPGFVDFSGGDFRLRSDAFSIGQGNSFSGLPSNDIIGTPYNNPRPLGCFEYLK